MDLVQEVGLAFDGRGAPADIEPHERERSVEQVAAVGRVGPPGRDVEGDAGIRDRGIQHWADPRQTRPGEINHNDGGRGVYFQDPAGHYLEIITRPYGSGG